MSILPNTAVLHTLFQELEDDTLLAEALLFPELSTHGINPTALTGKLAKHAAAIVEAEDIEMLHQRSLGSRAIQVRDVQVEIRPPKESIHWRQPVTLRFDFVTWSHTDQAQIAYVPVLGIEVMANSVEKLDELIPRHIHAELARRRASRSLRELMMLQRCRCVEAASSTYSYTILPPKEKVLQARQDEQAAEDKGSLTTVLTSLHSRSLQPAYEVDEKVRHLADALTGYRSRSVLLIGESGSGKTAVLHELIRRRAQFGLADREFWATTGARIIAGMSGFGAWQERGRQIVTAMSKRNAILHIGSLAELVDVGKHEGNDAGLADFLRTYLNRGAFLAVAECTPAQHATLERDCPQVVHAFLPMTIDQPSRDVTARILSQYAAASSRTAASLEEEALATVDRLHMRFAPYSARPGRALRFLRHMLQDHRDTGSIDGGDVTQAFARETGLPMLILDENERLDIGDARDWFARRIIGQGEAVDLVVDLMATLKTELNRPHKPIASLLFAGPTGVGKTQMAKSLARFLFSDEERITRFDMSEYASPAAVARLVGTAYGTEGVLTARVREHPFSVVLLDEFEKAHPAFFDLLLQILGEGRLTDAAGRVADFCSTVVIMTSNLGAESYQQDKFGFATTTNARRDAQAHFADAVRAHIRPELFNRLDRIVPFAPLDEATVRLIARREVDLAGRRDGIAYRHIDWDIGDDVVAHLARSGFDPRYGARPLKRAVEGELLRPLADSINRYDARLPLTVTTSVSNGTIQARAKARTGAKSPDGRVDDTSSALITHVYAVAEARRKIQRFDRGSIMLKLRNELYNLQREQERRRKRAHKDPDHRPTPEDIANTKRMTVLTDVIGGLAKRATDVMAYERGLLCDVYARRPVDIEAVKHDGEERAVSWYSLLDGIHASSRRWEDPITIAVLGMDALSVKRIATWLQAAAKEWNQASKVRAFIRYREGYLPQPIMSVVEEIDWRTIAPSVVAIEVRGVDACRRFRYEGGTYKIKEKGQQSVCRVRVSPEPLVDYWARDNVAEEPCFWGNSGPPEFPDRRTIDLDNRWVHDELLDSQYPARLSNMERVFKRIVEDRFRAELEEMAAE